MKNNNGNNIWLVNRNKTANANEMIITPNFSLFFLYKWSRIDREIPNNVSEINPRIKKLNEWARNKNEVINKISVKEEIDFRYPVRENGLGLVNDFNASLATLSWYPC